MPATAHPSTFLAIPTERGLKKVLAGISHAKWEVLTINA